MIVKGTAKLKRIMYPRGVYSTSGEYTIASFEPINVEEGELDVNEKYNSFTIKGELPPLNEKSEYYFIVDEGEKHPQYGTSYEIIFMRQNVDLNEEDDVSVRSFLEMILTQRQVNSLYEAFDNPIAVIESGDLERLTEAKGIGMKVAQRIVDHYESQKDYSLAYIELGKFGISTKTIKKIADFFGSPELAVQKVKENPYTLMDIDGYAFKKCDKIFLQLGGDFDADIRIKSFLVSFLQNEATNGHTWSTPMNLIEATVEFIPDIDKTLVGRMLLDSDDFYMSEDKKKISLLSYQRLEDLVAGEIIRLLKADNTFEYDGWEEQVKDVEEKQGWEFTNQQKEAMLMMFNSNISILQGYGGTGKTTTLKAVADILEYNGYIYAQCALSGKASSNLAQVTGKDGSTIHRLLSFSPITGGFLHNKRNKLPYDIIIIDEISMVDARLFGHLLLAMRDGAKLIMLGDSEQLESIGVPVMIPLIQSGAIPTMTLTEIHRQAQKSAVVTDSIAIRQGKQVISKESGRVIHGELQDLEYELVEQDKDIFIHVMREFHKYIQTEDVMDIQILTQVREKGAISSLSLNKACQKIYNPPNPTKDEVLVGRINKKKNALGVDEEEVEGYYLRQGDKVMNIRNNYSSVDEEGISAPIFNGNIGKILEFKEDEEGDKYMLIDFEGIGLIRIYESDYKSISLAYTITVHKSQGSSAKIVIIALPYHFMLNNRQLLYTAITRTREHCIVIATKKTIMSCIRKDETKTKRTYLSEYVVDKEKDFKVS